MAWRYAVATVIATLLILFIVSNGRAGPNDSGDNAPETFGYLSIVPRTKIRPQEWWVVNRLAGDLTYCSLVAEELQAFNRRHIEGCTRVEIQVPLPRYQVPTYSVFSMEGDLQFGADKLPIDPQVAPLAFIRSLVIFDAKTGDSVLCWDKSKAWEDRPQLLCRLAKL